MKRVLYPAIAFLALCVLHSSCSVVDVYSGEGTFVYIGGDCKFYGLFADDGEHYEVVNLETDYPEFQVDSLRVKYRVKDLEEQSCLSMWGTRVEALSLKKLEE
jgi:hypothetical protein